MIRRKLRLVNTSMIVVGMAMTVPVWAVSLSAVGSVQQRPGELPGVPADADEWNAGSASLVPLMANEMQANRVAAADSRTSDATTVGKPLDDIAFVRVATENGRKEVSSARAAMPQLKTPELKRIAEMLVIDHNNANARLSMLAEAKAWPVPPPTAPEAAAAGTAGSNFDASWTAEMIAGHERSVALYRAQAASGEDKDLRKYARDILPAIERHLTELKSFQK